VDAWPSDIGSRAEKRVTKDGVLPLRLDLADRGPFKKIYLGQIEFNFELMAPLGAAEVVRIG